ncbi:hypothetical protein PC9H_009815 [Pleurotus ostreatus]|uniref:Uncharacterized protein n=1 Tax=Pleurotus ostreatus TaxID=5322 RepID=A0A8H6ZMM2_PLEOS|nr:uncharacterized protein PC9H_009815 [Pleurotus ostreatus]KAF7424508.1 hypothetical protein PC9H_009815 [Pleurotus ostreatus]
MSCLPFVLDPRRPEESIDVTMSPRPIAGYIPPRGHPHEAPTRVLSICIGTRLRGLVRKMVFITNNAVTGQRLATRTAFQWANSGGTLFVMHVTCADILRRIFDAEDMNTKSLARVSQIEEVVGKVQGGASAGWLPLVRYKEVGEKIDLAPFWSHQPDTPSMGSNVFDWARLENSRYKWLVSRPDFVAKVDEKRLPWGDDFEVGEGSRLSHHPLELLYLLLPHLSPRSYAMLASTFSSAITHSPSSSPTRETSSSPFARPYPQRKNTKSRPRRSVASWHPKTRSWRPSMGIVWVLVEGAYVERDAGAAVDFGGVRGGEEGV